MFKSPFSFRGRIRRLEYGISNIILVIYYSVFAFATNSFNETNSAPSTIFLISLIPLYWFILAQGAKRCHDLDNSGWYQLIPFYGFWLLFADGKIGNNEYGANPKGIGNVDEVDEIGSYLEA